MFSDKNEFLRDVSGVSIDLGLLPFPLPVVDCVLCEDMTNRGSFTGVFEANKTFLYAQLENFFVSPHQDLTGALVSDYLLRSAEALVEVVDRFRLRKCTEKRGFVSVFELMLFFFIVKFSKKPIFLGFFEMPFKVGKTVCRGSWEGMSCGAAVGQIR